jgi:hypothetical protein
MIRLILRTVQVLKTCRFLIRFLLVLYFVLFGTVRMSCIMPFLVLESIVRLQDEEVALLYRLEMQHLSHLR